MSRLKTSVKIFILILIALTLCSGSIASQDTLKIIDDRALILNASGDTIFTYGQESHHTIELMFEEQGLLIAEVINQYNTIDEQLKRNQYKDSLYTNLQQEYDILTLQKNNIQERLIECESSQRTALNDITAANNTIKKQNVIIKKQKIINRARTVLEGATLAIILYLSLK